MALNKASVPVNATALLDELSTTNLPFHLIHLQDYHLYTPIYLREGLTAVVLVSLKSPPFMEKNLVLAFARFSTTDKMPDSKAVATASAVSDITIVPASLPLSDTGATLTTWSVISDTSEKRPLPAVDIIYNLN